MSDRPAQAMSDEALLDLLAAACIPATSEPTPEAVAEVRLMLAWRAGHRQRWRWIPGRVQRWRPRLAIASGAAGVVVLGAGTAFAAGAPLPPPVRALAYDIGLPVTPPAVVQVQDDAQALRTDLARGSGASPSETARDADQLAHALRSLAPGERSSVTSSQHVLDRACQALRVERSTPSAHSSASSSESGCPANPGSVVPPSTVPVGTGQDGSGQIGAGYNGRGQNSNGVGRNSNGPNGNQKTTPSGAGAGSGHQPGTSGGAPAPGSDQRTQPGSPPTSAPGRDGAPNGAPGTQGRGSGSPAGGREVGDH